MLPIGGRYAKRLLYVVSPIVRREADKPGSKAQFARNIQGIAMSQNKGQPPSLSPRDRYFLDTFHFYSEICSTLGAIELALKFVKRFRRARRRAVVELRYHIEKHFEEVYILKCRVEAHLNRLTKRLRNLGLVKPAKVLQETLATVVATLDDVLTTRGRHVHQVRYYDDDITRAETLELVANVGHVKEMAPQTKKIVSELAEKWEGLMKQNLAQLRKLLNKLFAALEVPVYDLAAPKN